MLIAQKVQGLSNTWDIIAENGGNPLLSIIPLDANSSAYPSAMSAMSYGLGTQPAGGKFFDDLDTYEPETIIDHTAARAQAKKADNQSIECRKVINRNASTTVGRGLKLKPTPDHEIIGITLEEASAWAKNTGSRYFLWCKSKDSDIKGINNYHQNQRFAWRQRKLLGEVFPIFKYSDDPKLLNPLQIGFIDPNQVRGDELTFSSGPESQDTGLIKNSDGKTIAIKIWTIDHTREGHFKETTVDTIDKDTGLPLILHMFEPRHAGQERGITELLPAFSDLEKITGFKAAALDKIKNRASRDYVIENEQADPSDMDLNALNTTSAGTATKTTTGATATDGEILPWTYTGISGSQHITGMVISGGRQGDKLKATPDEGPGETVKDFVGMVENSISAAANMAPQVVNMEVSTSFTAAKGAFGLQDIESRIERDDLESDLENAVYFAWLSGEIAAGRIKAIGWSDPIIRAAWLKKRLVGDPAIVLNPAQDSTAAEKNIMSGALSLSERAETLNGSDYEINAATLKKELEILPTNSSLKVVPPTNNDGE